MASSALSPSKPADDEFILNELVSELHALKKLYGLLQNNSATPVGPDQPTAHVLDEKSRYLLKNLLDGATQQALQSQAKIISGAPETTKSLTVPNSKFFNDDLQKQKDREIKKAQACQPTAAPENSREATISTLAVKSEITQIPCPKSEPSRNNHHRSKVAAVLQHRANDTARLDRHLMSGPSSRSMLSQSSKKDGRCVRSIKNGSSELPPSLEKRGDLFTLVPIQKRARVEPVDLPSRITKRNQKPVLDDRELNHQKRTSRKQQVVEPITIRSMQRMHSSNNQSLRSMALVADQMAQIVQKNDHLTESKTQLASNEHVKPAGANRSKTKRISTSSSKEVIPAKLNRSKAKRISTSSSKESTQSVLNSICSTKSNSFNSQKHNRTKTEKKIGLPPQPTLSNSIAQKSPSRHLFLGSPKTLTVRKTDQSTKTKSRANKPIKSSQPNRSRVGRCSSSSIGSTRSKSVSNWSTRSDLFTPRKQSRVKTRGRRRRSPPPASPKHLIPHHPVVPQWKPPTNWPARTRMEQKPEEEKDKQGRFKKLTNKLAIIFHHHHHHRHHLHAKEGKKSGGCGRKDHDRSLWKYLKGFLHVRKGSGEVQGKVHSYNLRVLMEWIFHHLWWMRQRRRKKVERRRVTKKVKWWDWFRRKGGVVVGGRRRIRLRLGFNGSRRRAGRGNA